MPNGSFGAERKAVESVTLSREGLVRRVAIAQSSGDARFDAAALLAVKRTAFAPAARSCVAVDSTFGYQIVSRAGGSVATAVIPRSIRFVASRP
ncbi:MAG: energy transducer TonB [Candidatus Eremiobacteraeota bacterium]|nr:energy transducer TonB [Candidatus Eremiobacteraeota bacterium]